MPVYEHRCSACRSVQTSEERDATKLTCALCGARLKRRYNFYSPPPFREGFNHSVGTYISSNRELREELKRASEKATIRSGTETTYAMVGPDEASGVGVTAELPHAVEEKWHKEKFG